MDLKASVAVRETPSVFAERCQVVWTSGLDEAAVHQYAPDFIVLEFDYPNRQDLAHAQSFKDKFPHVPIVVVTVQHSEALAVWFFRGKFHNYLVRPLSATEVAQCLAGLQEIRNRRNTQERRGPIRTRSRLPSEAGSGTNARHRLHPAVALVERSFHQRLLVTDAAAATGMPAFKFGREFKEEFGMDFREYVLRHRLREACRLLENPNASVTEVCYSVGFSDPAYFSKMFRRLIGRPPSEVVGMSGCERLIADPQHSPNSKDSSAKS